MTHCPRRQTLIFDARILYQLESVSIESGRLTLLLPSASRLNRLWAPAVHLVDCRIDVRDCSIGDVQSLLCIERECVERLRVDSTRPLDLNLDDFPQLRHLFLFSSSLNLRSTRIHSLHTLHLYNENSDRSSVCIGNSITIGALNLFGDFQVDGDGLSTVRQLSLQGCDPVPLLHSCRQLVNLQLPQIASSAALEFLLSHCAPTLRSLSLQFWATMDPAAIVGLFSRHQLREIRISGELYHLMTVTRGLRRIMGAASSANEFDHGCFDPDLVLMAASFWEKRS